jgi:hypothetical protein
LCSFVSFVFDHVCCSGDSLLDAAAATMYSFEIFPAHTRCAQLLPCLLASFVFCVLCRHQIIVVHQVNKCNRPVVSCHTAVSRDSDWCTPCAHLVAAAPASDPAGSTPTLEPGCQMHPLDPLPRTSHRDSRSTRHNPVTHTSSTPVQS